MAGPFASRQVLPVLTAAESWRPAEQVVPASNRQHREAAAKLMSALDAAHAVEGYLSIGRTAAPLVVLGRDAADVLQEWCAQVGMDYAYQPNPGGDMDWCWARVPLSGRATMQLGIPAVPVEAVPEPALDLRVKAALADFAAEVVLVAKHADPEPALTCFDGCGTTLDQPPARLAKDQHPRCEECLDERLGVERREQWEADRDEAGDRALDGRRDSGRV